eukprot:TRINITY_DN636_c18_g1_i1.p1 TRINITY_DN636_c18_g1~~TRINITY_DN636_c18_g1_i1.p1  ORF type:complete len:527 (+),score=141.65 TRINITY_DN636_c18_g1_i1:68-1582(+)
MSEGEDSAGRATHVRSANVVQDSRQTEKDSRAVSVSETPWMREQKGYIRQHGLHKLLGDTMDELLCMPDKPAEPLVFVAERTLRSLLQGLQQPERRQHILSSRGEVEHLRRLKRTLDALVEEADGQAAAPASSPVVPTPPPPRAAAESGLGDSSVTSPAGPPRGMSALSAGSCGGPETTPAAPGSPTAAAPSLPGPASESSPAAQEATAATSVPAPPSSAAPTSPPMMGTSQPASSPTHAAEGAVPEIVVPSGDADAPRAGDAAGGAAGQPPKRCEWEEFVTDSGRKFWAHKHTKEKTWDKPQELLDLEEGGTREDWTEVRQHGTDGRSQVWFYNARTGAKQWHRPSIMDAPAKKPKSGDGADGGEEVGEWKAFTCGDGRTFFVHQRTNQKQWTKPRELADPMLSGTDWVECQVKGQSYYWNTVTNVKTWDREKVVVHIQDSKRKQQEKSDTKGKTDPTTKKDLGNGWYEYRTTDNRVFYQNRVTKEKSWRPPAISPAQTPSHQ